MDKVTLKTTVFFEDPFWIGLLEREEDGKLSVSKITFGPEPKDYEVLSFLLGHYQDLRFSPPVEMPETGGKKLNPKRMQRSLRRHKELGVGTKSQQALAAQREAVKTERKERRKEMREEREHLLFLKKQQKKKQKHRGR